MKIDELIDFANKAKLMGAIEATVNSYENITFLNSQRTEVAWIDDAGKVARFIMEEQE